MKKYKKKPIEVEAIQYSHSIDTDLVERLTHCVGTHGHLDFGTTQVNEGEWIVFELGRRLIIPNEIFEQTYEII